MSGDWWQQRGSVSIPVLLAFGAVGNPNPGPGIPGSGFIVATNPDQSGPATMLMPGCSGPVPFYIDSGNKNASCLFKRGKVTGNFPLPGPTLAQLWTSFGNNGPGTNNGGAMSSTNALPTPTASQNKLQNALSAKRGFANFSYCRGATVNPACATHKTNGDASSIPVSQGTQHGIIKYTAATPQFGGTMRMIINGVGAVSTVVGATPKFSHAQVGGGGAAQAAAVGGHYANTNTNSLPAGPVTTGAVTTTFGAIAAPGATIGTGIAAINKNVGMPWTVGNVYAKVTVTNGAMITTVSTMGYDTRTVNGRGNIQLVAMGITNGLASAGNYISIDRVRMDISSSQLTPAISPTGMVALGSLLVLGGGYVLRKRLA